MKLHRIVLTIAIICCTIPAGALDIKNQTFSTENAGKVVFSHTNHLKKKNDKSPNISCKACHNDAMKKGVHYTMAQMEQGKSCGQCHNGKQAFALAKCAACHKVKDISFKVKETGPVLFKHTAHLRKESDCSACHNKLYKTGPNPRVSMAFMEKGKSCGACHNSKQAFSIKECSKCHPVRELVFEDKTLGNVIFSHKFHIGLYSCVDCHTSLFKAARSKNKVSMREMEEGKSCGSCHDGKTAFSVKDKCGTCHQMKASGRK
jgi:c(7)-type cytochrome triheme protein